MSTKSTINRRLAGNKPGEIPFVPRIRLVHYNVEFRKEWCESSGRHEVCGIETGFHARVLIVEGRVEQQPVILEA
jgi:hypothetical protein